MKASSQPVTLGKLPIGDGWGEGNDGAGSTQAGSGAEVAIIPLTDNKKPDPYGLQNNLIRIYLVEDELKAFAKVVFRVPNGCGDLSIHFEVDGPFYPGCGQTEHGNFDHDLRRLNIHTDGFESDEGILTVTAQTDYLHRDRYTLTVANGSAEELNQVDLVKNTTIE